MFLSIVAISLNCHHNGISLHFALLFAAHIRDPDLFQTSVFFLLSWRAPAQASGFVRILISCSISRFRQEMSNLINSFIFSKGLENTTAGPGERPGDTVKTYFTDCTQTWSRTHPSGHKLVFCRFISSVPLGWPQSHPLSYGVRES